MAENRAALAFELSISPSQTTDTLQSMLGESLVNIHELELGGKGQLCLSLLGCKQYSSESLSLGPPRGILVVGRMVGDVDLANAISVHDIYFLVAVPIRLESDFGTIG